MYVVNTVFYVINVALPLTQCIGYNCAIKQSSSTSYKLFKKTFGLEEYLEFGLDRKYRQCLSSFRISDHKLQIERGRYLGTNVEERKCTDYNVIEDEIHFFCDCNK